jgi:two-component SAPR family response regulator
MLITDFSMSKWNGIKLGIKVKELNDNIKILLISAHENIECDKLDFEILNKPILIQTLIDKVNQYIK